MPTKSKVLVICPYPNPHLLDVIHSSCEKLNATCDVYAFDSLPPQRTELGWQQGLGVHRLDRTAKAWLHLASQLRRAEIVVQLGMATPRIRMLLCHRMARLAKRHIWLASEGFRSNPSHQLKLLAKFYNSSAVTLLAIGDGAADDFRTAGITKPSIHKFGFAEKTLDLEIDNGTKPDGDRARILSVGQLIGRKNHAALIRACSNEELRTKVEVRICGSGPLRNELESIAKTAGVSLTLPGNCSPDRLASEYAAADIFAMPSHYDGWGVTLNHAVIAGLPCVVSRHVRAGADNLVENKSNGYIFDDEGELRRYLAALVEDSELRHSMSEASKRIGQLWTVDSLSERLATTIGSEQGDDFSSGPLSKIRA